MDSSDRGGIARGSPDHDSTARRGIMDTIIRERLEVLVIFLLPHLTRALVVERDSHRQAGMRTNETQIAAP